MLNFGYRAEEIQKIEDDLRYKLIDRSLFPYIKAAILDYLETSFMNISYPTFAQLFYYHLTQGDHELDVLWWLLKRSNKFGRYTKDDLHRKTRPHPAYVSAPLWVESASLGGIYTNINITK